MIKNILTALTESLILESYKDVKTRFINDGANKDEVTKLLDLHKKLKDMKRLKDNEVNIDVLTKGKSFDDFKSLMSRYSEKDTETKTDKWAALKKKIVAENDEWSVYKIDKPEEAYLFHGLVKWCISSGTPQDARQYFKKYAKIPSAFFAIVRKNPIGDRYDYIMDQYKRKTDVHTYWDAEDSSHSSLNRNLNVPSYDTSTITKSEEQGILPGILKKFKLNADGTYSCLRAHVTPDMLKFFIKDGKLTIKFKEVRRFFDCSECGLISLEGCPEKVGESFDCHGNKLTSLEGAPKEVGRNFDCSRNNLTSLKGGPEKVDWSFDCSRNNLTSLEGAPKEVGDNFDCYNNNLTSLEGVPRKVGHNFDCSGNKLKSLKGAPEKVGHDFYCTDCNLTTLEGSPKEVGWDYICSSNDLTSLEGAPKKIRRHFNCSENKLTSLKGAPEEVGGEFNCKKNELTSLEGAPKTVSWYFDCEYNKLTTLKGAPKEVGWDFKCSHNKLKSLDGIGKVNGEIISDIKQ